MCVCSVGSDDTASSFGSEAEQTSRLTMPHCSQLCCYASLKLNPSNTGHLQHPILNHLGKSALDPTYDATISDGIQLDLDNIYLILGLMHPQPYKGQLPGDDLADSLGMKRVKPFRHDND